MLTLAWIWPAALLPYNFPLAVAFLQRQHATPILVAQVIPAKPGFDSTVAKDVKLTHGTMRREHGEATTSSCQHGAEV
jgi:hypothetical protein